MYSYGSPHMAAQKRDDQLERTFSSYVRIQDVVLKTYLGRWTIGRSGERGSGISVLPARYDDDDDEGFLLLLLILLLVAGNHKIAYKQLLRDMNTWNHLSIYLSIYSILSVFLYISINFSIYLPIKIYFYLSVYQRYKSIFFFFICPIGRSQNTRTVPIAKG